MSTQAAPTAVTTTWWRRNRFWLALLTPMLLLAVVASSFRMVNLYLPWEWSRPLVAHGPSGTLRQEFHGADGQHRTREVRVGVLSAIPQDRFEDVRAAPGAVLWRVLLEFEASPEQMLASVCTIELVDAAGTRYGHQGGQEAADERGLGRPPMFLTCVPGYAPGPSLGVLGEFEESPVERPRTWRMQYVFATPATVEPSAVRIGWDQPEYLVLQVP